MLSMQQLEELENRVIKALQLISDLRTENAKLENDNEALKGENEDLKLTLEEKDLEVAKIKKELDKTAKELQELKEKEEILEKKIISLLGKLDVVQSGPIPAGDSFGEDYSGSSEESGSGIAVESVDSSGPEISDEDEDVIIIDDEADMGEGDLVLETDEGASEDEDEIILLDDDDDEIVIDDVEEGKIIVDDSDEDEEFLIVEDEEK